MASLPLIALDPSVDVDPSTLTEPEYHGWGSSNQLCRTRLPVPNLAAGLVGPNQKQEFYVDDVSAEIKILEEDLADVFFQLGDISASLGTTNDDLAYLSMRVDNLETNFVDIQNRVVALENLTTVIGYQDFTFTGFKTFQNGLNVNATGAAENGGSLLNFYCENYDFTTGVATNNGSITNIIIRNSTSLPTSLAVTLNRIGRVVHMTIPRFELVNTTPTYSEIRSLLPVPTQFRPTVYDAGGIYLDTAQTSGPTRLVLSIDIFGFWFLKETAGGNISSLTVDTQYDFTLTYIV